jgi:3-dehydrocarnitine:acetyl-CoA trimethylamine transferase
MLAAEVFITCAVTGSADSVRKNPNVPVTPAQIAASALEAYAAGAAIVHLHAHVPQNVCRTRSPGCGGSA